jgi:Fe(II)/alpha-ketoglutarate-dependent arginine beta-hydroxylase
MVSETAAWPITRFRLEPADATALRGLAIRVVTECSGDLPDARLRRIAHLSQELPIALRCALVDLRISGDGGLVLSGAPVVDADLGASPPIVGTPARSDELARADAMLLLVASFLGFPVSQAGVEDGQLVRDISPRPGNETTQLGSSSSGELMWHNEDAYHPLRPDWICLLCLRNPDGTATSFARIDDVEIDEPTRSILFQPRFHIAPDASHSVGADSAKPSAVAVLSGDSSHPYVRLDPAFMVRDPEDDEACDALETVIKAVDRQLQDVRLSPGEILIIDNLRSIHGRRPFTADYNGRDRWLRVVHAAADLRRSEGFRTGDHGRAIFAEVGPVDR